MKSFAKIIIPIAILCFFPLSASALEINIWEGTSCATGGGGPTEPCTFCDALIVIKNIVTILFEIAIPITVVMIIWGALIMMVAGGSEEKVKKGRGVITNSVTGLAIALAAWIIVNTVLHVLTGQVDFPWNQINCG